MLVELTEGACGLFLNSYPESKPICSRFRLVPVGDCASCGSGLSVLGPTRLGKILPDGLSQPSLPVKLVYLELI